ncbi:MAG TPA: phage major capsid protein [Marmoricola sp.]|nr:phage major capsid protein [Marmoricola sp.]
MPTLQQLRDQGRALLEDQRALIEDDKRPWSAKKTEYEKRDGDIKAVLEQSNALAAVDGRPLEDVASLHAGGPVGDGRNYGGPSLALSTEQMQALHNAATSKQSLKVMNAALDVEGDIPASLTSSFVAFRREPTRVASLFPSRAVDGPSVEYIRHTGNTGTATTVAAGGAKPEIVMNVDTVTAPLRKIAAHIGVNDESLMDFAATASYVSNELVAAVVAAENDQLLNGNGTAPNIEGLLSVAGVLTRAQSTETALDTLEMALNDLRVGAAFTEATGVVMHPSDFSDLRLAKDGQQRYLLGAPTAGEPATLWGKPVVVTTQIPAKTVVVGNFAVGGEVLYRRGIVIETNSSGTDWTSNITRFRGEERLTLAIVRPSAFVKVTLT